MKQVVSKRKLLLRLRAPRTRRGGGRCREELGKRKEKKGKKKKASQLIAYRKSSPPGRPLSIGGGGGRWKNGDGAAGGPAGSFKASQRCCGALARISGEEASSAGEAKPAQRQARCSHEDGP